MLLTKRKSSSTDNQPHAENIWLPHWYKGLKIHETLHINIKGTQCTFCEVSHPVLRYCKNSVSQAYLQGLFNDHLWRQYPYRTAMLCNLGFAPLFFPSRELSICVTVRKRNSPFRACRHHFLHHWYPWIHKLLFLFILHDHKLFPKCWLYNQLVVLEKYGASSTARFAVSVVAA